MAKTFKKIILDDLKAQGRADIVKKIKSIRYESYSGGDSVSVQAENLFKTDRDFLSSLLKEYQHGFFDGMNDIYNYVRSEKERSAKYVFLYVSFTEDVKEYVKKELEKEWGIVDDQTAQKKRHCRYDICVHQDIMALESSDLQAGSAE